MADTDDRHWLDALMGRPAAADAALAAVKEGAVVRQAMQASQRTLPRFDADAGLRRVLDRLRDENLLGASKAGRIGWKVPAVAAGVALVIALGIALRERPGAPPPAPEIPVMSGDPGAVQSVVTFEAREIAAELRGTMTQAGLAPTVTEIGAMTRLEADWPRRPSDAQLEFLRGYGFARPNGPQLKIEIRPPQQ